MTEAALPPSVNIHVDASKSMGPLKRIWRSIGYDEINWTYTSLGKRIFREIAALNDGPFWVRNHNIFSSGNLRSSPYEASTNCYTEDANGDAVYDWTTVDRIYDIYVANGCKPMIELDFMPHALSAFPQSDPYKSGRFGPRDFTRWRELNYQFARHLIERYGRQEVRTWYFTAWNEPDLDMWLYARPEAVRPQVFGHGGEDARDTARHADRRELFLKIHDYAMDGILAADEQLRIGGPDIAIAPNPDFLEMFLRHCESGVNYATGKTGSRLDFLSFHCKGTAKSGTRVPSPDFDWVARRALTTYMSTVKRFPKFAALPLLCNEWDIDVWSPAGIYDSPDFRFRNTSYFPVFVIRTMKELLDLREREGFNLELVTQWTFYFHGGRCFEGDRSIFDATGIRRPLFNGFEMLARLGAERLALNTDDTLQDVQPGEATGVGRRPRDEQDEASMEHWQRVQPHPRVDGLAARSGDQLQVLVWNQVCDQYSKGDREVHLRITGLGGAKGARVTEFRIDDAHSNAHSVWEALGRPDWPDDGQIEAMQTRDALETAQPERTIPVTDGEAGVRIILPMHAVSLFIVKPVME